VPVHRGAGRWLVLGLAVADVVLSSGAIMQSLIQNSLTKTQILLNGFSRLGNLATTVSLICFDYFKTLQDNKNLSVKKFVS
jgi:hypothetical protein